MKFCHILTESKFLNSQVHLYSHYFSNQEHELCFLKGSNNPSSLRTDCTIPQNEYSIFRNRDIVNFPSFILKLLKADYIIAHSLFFPDRVIRLLSYPLFRSKLIWIEWGGDLYNWDETIPKGLSRDVAQRIREKCYAFVAIFPPDIEYYKKVFPNSKALVFYAPYTGGYKPQISLKERYCLHEGCTHDITKPYRILVGHNGMETLNHIAVLNLLKRFYHENIELILSLSYGASDHYIMEVENTANRLFPDKVIILKHFMEKNLYFSIIDSVDIAIFMTNRQCGLGNISQLLNMNKKLFISEDCPMYGFFRSKGFNISAVESISEQHFDEFVSTGKPLDREKIMAYFDELDHPNQRVEYWRKIYDKLKKEQSVRYRV